MYKAKIIGFIDGLMVFSITALVKDPEQLEKISQRLKKKYQFDAVLIQVEQHP
jgi:hypothetical protein